MFGIQRLKAPIWSVIFSLFLLISCQNNDPIANGEAITGVEFRGETQGTTYHVILAENVTSLTKASIDSLLHEFDLALSTYIDESVVSKINASTKDTFVLDHSGFFQECYRLSKSVFEQTNGAFDPTVFPLVKGWGFMNNMDSPLSQNEVDSILQFVGFEKNHSIRFSGDSIFVSKSNPHVKLDFNAIAQGYSVDVVADFIRSLGHDNFYVEIGGELTVSGKNRSGEKWSIGLDVPESDVDGRPLENIFYLSDKAVATSGNYRKFYEVNGQKFAHTLNPKTGFPVQHSLLSASVVTENCALADAYATAFMVMGTNESLRFVEQHPDLKLEIYLLSSTSEGKYERSTSASFDQFLKAD